MTEFIELMTPLGIVGAVGVVAICFITWMYEMFTLRKRSGVPIRKKEVEVLHRMWRKDGWRKGEQP